MKAEFWSGKHGVGSKLVGERNRKLHFSFRKTSPSEEHLNRSESESHSVRLFATPWTVQSMEFSRPEYWSGILLKGILPTQGLNPGLWHCRQILYQLSHKGSPYFIVHWGRQFFHSFLEIIYLKVISNGFLREIIILLYQILHHVPESSCRFFRVGRVIE